jgi:predicted enzyme related to lactoylglutathione lyase
MKKMNPVVHFEMPAEDNARASKFYETAFGWQMQQMGEEMGGYLLATTTPVDERTQRAKEPGAINGGFFKKGEYGSVPHLVIAVDNLAELMETVKKAGGEVQGEPMDIPGVGKFVMIKDTEGNRVGMLQPSPM